MKKTETNSILNLKSLNFKLFLLLFFLLPFSAFAQLNWSGNQVLTNGQNVTQNVTLTGHTLVHVASGATATISGVIIGSSSYTLYKTGEGTLILTGANTYYGNTSVNAGTLQIGNGIVANTSINNTLDVGVTDGATLRFVPGANMFFSKNIHSYGKMEVNCAYNKDLFLTGYNICQSVNSSFIVTGNGTLHIGNNTPTGEIKGNIVINNAGGVNFRRSNDYTYSFEISGTGPVLKYGAGKLIFTSKNTYTGITSIFEGTLQVGNGTNTYVGIDQTSQVYLQVNSKLRFEPSSAWVFSKNINGHGIVEFKGSSGKTLALTGTVFEPGTTTGKVVVESGQFLIGNNTTTGSVNGNIELSNSNSELHFFRSNDYIYSEKISGSGSVSKYRFGKLTLDAENDYTGTTYIMGGTLALSSTGKVEYSSGVSLQNEDAKFDISAGNKTIRALNATAAFATSQVILGNKTLTLGISAGHNSGGGTFSGIFTGAGGNVTKQGTATFTMTNSNNTANGTFNLMSGTLNFSGIWHGNFAKQVAGTLTITNSATISGKLNLYCTSSPAPINMNLSTSIPSKLTVTGAVESGTQYPNPINISGIGSTDSYVLLQAASGINVSNFTLTGISGTLTSPSSAQLVFTKTGAFVAVTDIINLPATATATIPLTLSGTVVPSSATNQTIIWGVVNSGTTGATITDNILNTTAAGTCSLLAKIVNGTSTTTDFTKQFTVIVNKGTQEAPAAPTMLSHTSESITLNAVDGCEYNITGGAWQSSPIFTGLTPNTSYIFAQRKAETPSHLPSPGSEAASFTTKDGVGIESITNDELRITVYPNPTTGEFQVTSDKLQVTSVEVFDIYGRKNITPVTRHSSLVTCHSSLVTINISHLPTGIYFLKIHTDKGLVNKKIIKQ